MLEVEVYTRIVVGILGMAYPLLLGVIARLHDKYESTNIVELFDDEWEKKLFKWILFTSLISIFIWSIKFKPLFHYDGFNFLIENSAGILVIGSTTALVVVFFCFVSKIIIYSSQSKFINYLINKHNKTQRNRIKEFTDTFFNFLNKLKVNFLQSKPIKYIILQYHEITK